MSQYSSSSLNPYLNPSNTLLYWRNEQSGVLEKAVKNLFDETADLTDKDINNLKEYLNHWIMFPGFMLTEEERQNFMNQLTRIAGKNDIFALIHQLSFHCIDPL